MQKVKISDYILNLEFVSPKKLSKRMSKRKSKKMNTIITLPLIS